MLENNVVLITGASRGIGSALAIQFAKSGAIPILNYSTNELKALETLSEVKKHSPKSTYMKFDVSKYSEVEAAIEKILADYGKIDVLINNAGITRDMLLLRMKESEWDDVISINLKGVFNCTKAALRTMIKSRYGRIINMTSLVGATGNAGQANYAASKAGVIGFTKSMAQEVASRNITVNAIAPGFIVSDMTETISEAIKTEMLKRIPVGGFGTGEDIAHAALFLASPQAKYITGHVLHVNGGLYM